MSNLPPVDDSPAVRLTRLAGDPEQMPEGVESVPAGRLCPVCGERCSWFKVYGW